MKSVNLIPSRRRQAKARKTRTLQWVTALASYGLILLAGYLASIRYAAADRGPVAQEARQAAVQLEMSNRTVQALTQELGQAHQKLRTAQTVGQQPDWSRLLALLSQNLDDNLVLDLCRLQKLAPAEKAGPGKGPGSSGSGPIDPSRPPSVWRTPANLLLELEGFAKAQSHVSEYILRLEKTGLFDKVKLVKTSRQDFLNGKAVAFRLECTILSPEAATP